MRLFSPPPIRSPIWVSSSASDELTARRASSTSGADAGRSAGDFASSLNTSASRRPGTPSRNTRGGLGATLRCWLTTSARVPSNGGRPTRSSYSVAPSEYRSLRTVTGSPRASSGGMHARVVTMMSGSQSAAGAPGARARSKSPRCADGHALRALLPRPGPPARWFDREQGAPVNSLAPPAGADAEAVNPGVQPSRRSGPGAGSGLADVQLGASAPRTNRVRRCWRRRSRPRRRQSARWEA
jgi:hypothetical protein